MVISTFLVAYKLSTNPRVATIDPLAVKEIQNISTKSAFRYLTALPIHLGQSNLRDISAKSRKYLDPIFEVYGLT